jgi:hypothetical protein
MSQSGIFAIGAIVFALTVWGTVMAGGVWFGRIIEAEDARSPQRPVVAERGPSDVPGAPDPN